MADIWEIRTLRLYNIGIIVVQSEYLPYIDHQCELKKSWIIITVEVFSQAIPDLYPPIVLLYETVPSFGTALSLGLFGTIPWFGTELPFTTVAWCFTSCVFICTSFIHTCTRTLCL